LDIKEIKQVIELMKKSELTEFSIEEEGLKLHLKRGAADMPLPPVQYASPPAQTQAAAPEQTTKTAAETEGGDDGLLIRSPMVGTFYRSPSPDSAPFVDTGAKVAEDTVVCIVEAMKVMNEIQAEVKGTIAEILVENGETVEFNQPLFRLK